MRKFLRTIPLLVFLLAAAPAAYAGLSEGCYPAVECGGGQDYYGTSCQKHINQVIGPIADSCATSNPLGETWNFNCASGCYKTSIPVPPACPGGVMVSGNCLARLDVLKDNVPVTGEKAYKIYDGTDLTEIVHLGTNGCLDGEVAVSDTASASGWKCGAGGAWIVSGPDVYRASGKVGIGTAAPAAALNVVDPAINLVASFGGSGIGVTAKADGGGGLFTDANSTGFVALANDDIGISAIGSTFAGYFSDNANPALDTGNATLAGGGFGITASGNTMGGYFADANASGNAKLGVGDNGIEGRGNTAGGYFENITNSGLALLGFGDVGIWASGNTYGGYFRDNDNSGYSQVGWGDFGIRSFGNSAGGYFKDSNESGYAYVGYGNYGIEGSGSVAGGYFNDTSNADEEVFLANGTWSVNAAGPINIDEQSSSDAGSLYLGSDEAIWYHNDYFSWGYGGNYNYFADPVGIGQLSPTFKLQLPNSASDINGRGRANAWTTYSDSRVKMNQEPLKYGLEQVMALQPKSYDHYSSNFEDGKLILDENYSHEIGLVAQEVNKIIPEVVGQPVDENEELWGLDYDRLIPVLVKAIQELKSEKDAEIAELKAVVCELKPDSEVCDK